MQLKRCSNCSAELSCASQEGHCWCMAYSPVVIIEGQDCLCEACLKKSSKSNASKEEIAEPNYYIENDCYVFTSSYHLKRGYCCKNGCRHCPYGYKK